MKRILLVTVILLSLPFSASAKRVNGSEVDDYTFYFDSETQTWTIYEMVEKAKLREDKGVDLTGTGVKKIYLTGQVKDQYMNDLRLTQVFPYLKLERIFFTDTFSLIEDKIVKTGTEKEVLGANDHSTSAEVITVCMNMIFVFLPILWLVYCLWSCRTFGNEINLDNYIITTAMLFAVLLNIGSAFSYFFYVDAHVARGLSMVAGVILGIMTQRSLGYDLIRVIVGVAVALMGTIAQQSGMGQKYTLLILGSVGCVFIAQQVWRWYSFKKSQS